MRIRRTLVLPLVATLFCIIGHSAGAWPGNDPNAALRYLSAIGSIPAVSEDVLDELTRCETIDDFSQLATEAVAVLEKPGFKNAIQLIEYGAACSMCNYAPDNKGSILDLVPPYRRICQLARLAQTYAFLLERKGDLQGAVRALGAGFMLGQHLEDHGGLNSVPFAVGIRWDISEALLDMRARHPGPAFKEFLAAVVARIPDPAVHVQEALKMDRDHLEKGLAEAKTNPELFRLLGPEIIAGIPASFTAAASSTSPASSETTAGMDPLAQLKACQWNQRGLMCALAMLQMEHDKGIPASVSANLMVSLTTLGYVKSIPVCAAGGIYQIGFNGSATLATCSIHGSSEAPSEAASNIMHDAAEAGFRYLKHLVQTPEYDRQVAECLAIFDERLEIDPKAPDAEVKFATFKRRLESSGNILAKSFIPNFWKGIKRCDDLEKLINKLRH